MADSAISFRTPRGEVKIATDLVNDPQFGPVHLFRVVGGSGGSGGMSLVEFQGELPLPTSVGNFPASFGSVQSGAWSVGVNNFPAGFNVNNWPATQPVSLASVPSHAVTGPLTDTQLRAAAVPVSGTFWQATQPISAVGLPLPAGASTEATLAAVSGKLPATLGQKAMAASLGVVLASDQPTLPVSMAAAAAIFKGRSCGFNTPGRAGTAGQKVLSFYNTGTPSVYITRVMIDLACTVVKAITVAPPVIRLYKVTVAPTNGTVLAKNKIGGSGASDAGVVVRGDASGDNTGSASALTATLPAGAFVAQEHAPRFITGAGYEMADRIEFLDDTEVEVKTNEGVVLALDYTLATQNPTTDRWLPALEWRE